MNVINKKQLIKDSRDLVFQIYGLVFLLVGLFFIIGPTVKEIMIGSSREHVLLIFFEYLLIVGPIFCGGFGLGLLLPPIFRMHAIRKDDFTISYDTVTRYQHIGGSRKVHLKKYTRETNGKVYPVTAHYDGRIHSGDGVYVVYLHGKHKKSRLFYIASEWTLSKELTDKLE